ncbi:hypothetical protein ACEPAH_6750 [Sanghuangporus vaninii]
MESVPSSSSAAKSPVLLNTSASASFHSHLSVPSARSQRRLRALSRPDSDELPQHDKLKSPAILNSLPSSPQSQYLLLYSSGKAPQQKSYSALALHWLLAMYCFLSVAFFTVRLFAIPESIYTRNLNRNDSSISPIDSMPISYRLSKLLQSEPRPDSFSPFISAARPSYRNTDVTACIWIEAEEIKHLEYWSTNWDGPLSVVVIASSSQEARWIIRELENLPSLKDKANIHMVQRMSNETLPANSYLNSARLFAQTRFVMIFPGAPASPIPDKLYRRLFMHANKLNATRKAAPLVLSPSKFRPNNPFPFSPLSPLLIEQSYPIWCSERFFSAPSRGDSWEECLWQIWLNSYGRLSTLPGSGWKVPSTQRKSEASGTANSEVAVTHVMSETPCLTEDQEIIHRRLSNRFRHESCVLAAKRLKDQSVDSKVDPRKSQWLRKTCRQVMTGWAKELL